MALGLLQWIERRFLDSDGHPLSGGFLYSFVAGTSTPLDSYADSDGVSANDNPMELDIDGRAPNDIYVLPTGYKWEVRNSANVLQYTYDDVSTPGDVFAANMGTILYAGGKDVDSGYEQVATDRTITTNEADATDPFVLQLLPAADCTMDLTIVHFGSGDLSITPDGADTINGVAAAYVVTAGTTPDFPAITLRSDNVSGWLVISRAN